MLICTKYPYIIAKEHLVVPVLHTHTHKMYNKLELEHFVKSLAITKLKVLNTVPACNYIVRPSIVLMLTHFSLATTNIASYFSSVLLW